jgi:hypothetical protein
MRNKDTSVMSTKPAKPALAEETKALNWLVRTAKRRNLQLDLDEQSVREVAGRLHVPVGLSLGDAFDTAVALQKLEDGWNHQTTPPAVRLFLIPASTRTKTRK